jgi:hypothetical protein
LRRKVVGKFEGGTITSDAGGLLLREIDLANAYIADYATCFEDNRNQKKIEFELETLLRQRIFGICLGYEDLNDHDELRKDPLFATVCGKNDPTGNDREHDRDSGIPLAGKSTLNRMEYSTTDRGTPTRYKKILYNEEAIDNFFIDKFIQQYGNKTPEWLTLDIDATDDPVYGHQQSRFFHGYYDCYCYLPLYIFCGDDLLCAKLKTSNLDPGNEALPQIKKVVMRLKEKWPEVQIIIRGDSGFCREPIMNWIEKQEGVFYLVGLARNKRLYKRIRKELGKVKNVYEKTYKTNRIFKDFTYKTLKSWSKRRRVIGKAEYGSKGENPRFVVTNLKKKHFGAQELYEKQYCARGDMENRIKEQQLFLFADRTSCAMLAANQLRLYFAAVAYVIVNELRKQGLKETELSNAQCSTIRLKLFKIGAVVTISVRRVLVNYSSSYPYQELFYRVKENLRKAYPLLN